MSDIIAVVAHFQVKADKEQAALEAILTLVRETRKEAGCISYALHRSKDNPLQFVMLERWANQAALDEHFKQPYVQAVFAQAPEILDVMPNITYWSDVEP